VSYKLNLKHRNESIMLGLEPPHEHSLLCGCVDHKQASDTPTLMELDLAAREHRWPEMRNLEVDFFNAFMDQVTEHEEKAIEIFKLPQIEIIRESIITGDQEYPGQFEISTNQTREYKKILSQWQEQLIGNTELKKQIEEDESIYPYYMLSAYSIGIKNTKRQALRNAPQDLKPILEAIEIPPDANNLYLKGVKSEGLKRIKTKLADDYRDGVLSWLRIMAREGRNPLYVARWLHREYEGKAWYWNRLARSESVLALNASYDSWSEAARVPYDMWSAAADACPICTQFDGKLWRRGEGPYPVQDSHPHCRCLRIAQYQTQGRRVQERWTRSTPYDQPYNIDRETGTIPELEDLFG